MSKVNVAVLFGGQSTEHEVSIISAVQVMQNLDKSKYDLTPIYISKKGQWYLGNESFLNPETYKSLEFIESNFPKTTLVEKVSLSMFGQSLKSSLSKIDVAFPVFHGTFGEDGSIQGQLEMDGLPYVGSGVLASAIGMDKAAQKLIFMAKRLDQVKYQMLYREGVKNIDDLKFPLFVKPANGGSSIGVTKVKTPKQLNDALEVAFCYDRKAVVEESAEGFKEVNISVLGNSGSDLKTSVCEQPIASKEVLTYRDKYQSSTRKSQGMAGAKRLIPAPIKPATATRIASIAKTAYEALDCSGLVRADFLVSRDEKAIYINEINTIPGSLAFYLWEKSGLPFPKLLDQLIQLAFEKHQDRIRSTYTFNNNLLTNLGNSLKGGKLKG